MALGARFQAPRGSRFPWQVGGCTCPEWHRCCPPNARWERAPAEDGDVGAGSRPPSGPRLSGASPVPGPGASGRQRPSPVGPGPQRAASDGKQVRAEHSVRECEALTRKTKPGKRPTVTKAASDEMPRGDRSRISRSVTVTTDRSAGAVSTWGGHSGGTASAQALGWDGDGAFKQQQEVPCGGSGGRGADGAGGLPRVHRPVRLSRWPGFDPEPLAGFEQESNAGRFGRARPTLAAVGEQGRGTEPRRQRLLRSSG